MKLTAKLTIFIGSLYILAVVCAALVFKYIIEDELNLIDSKIVESSLYRVSNSIIDKAEDLATLTEDYAGWDDTYQYMEDRNQAYEKSNFVNETFIGTKIDLLLLLDTQGNQVYLKAFNHTTKQEITIPDEDIKLLTQKGLFLNNQKQKSDLAGIADLEIGNALLAAKPILTSTKEGPTRGTLIMARLIDTEILNSITKSTQTKFEIIDEKESDYIDKLLKKNPIMEIAGEKSVIGYYLAEDIFKDTDIIIKTTQDREIYAQGTSTLTTILLVLIGFGILFMLVSTWIIRKILIKPIQIIIKDLGEIKKFPGSKIKVHTKGNDEIGIVATEINSNLDSIRNYEAELLKINKQLEEQRATIERQILNRTQQLSEEHVRLMASIDSAPYGFALVDKAEHILLTNKVLAKILETGEVKNADLFEYANEQLDLRSVYKKVLSQGITIVKDNIRVKNKIVQIYVAPVLINYQEVSGVIINIIDVTEQKILERSKEELFVIASHELKTPLAAIKGNTNILRDNYLSSLKDQKLKEILSDIVMATNRMIQIVNDFLTTARLEQGRIPFNYTDFEIIPIINDLIKEWESSATQKGNTIKFISELPDEKLTVYADREKTKEILANLISNAIKYTLDGKIILVARYTGVVVEVEVSDTGLGISQENQNLLFRKFQQAGESLFARDSTKGTGLGLYISKLIVESMGGTIELKVSEKNKGTTFVFTLKTKKG